MKRLATAFCAAAFLFACNSEDKAADQTKIASATAEEKTTNDAWVPVDSATAMRTMMEAGTPGPQHAMLAKADGKWEAEMTMWMAPGASPQTSKVACVNRMLFGGRYQESSFKGSFGEWPFEGVSNTGYDNTKKVYFSTWMDNMSTAMMNMEGTWDEATKSITFKGKMICPANGKECEMREIFKFIDDNTQVMEMFGPDMQTGKEYKNMEIKFTRKK